MKIGAGLPGKSYLYIMEIDRYLKMALSSFSCLPFFDMYVMSLLSWKFRYKDREKMTKQFIMFMLVYDEDRINILIQNKFFKRSSFFSFLAQITISLQEYDKILEEEPSTHKNLIFYKIKSRLYPQEQVISRSIPVLYKKIGECLDLILSHYMAFTLKGLMLHRKGIANPDLLKTDAYHTIIEMVDNYDYTRSKIPFNNYLPFFIKATKNKTIKKELSHKESTCGELKWKELGNLPQQEHITQEHITQELDEIIGNLPPIFRKILVLQFGIQV